MRTPHAMNFSLPFYHLSTEPFWKLVIKPEINIALTSKKSIKSFQSLIQSVDHAKVDKGLFLYLSKNAEREILRKTFIDRYFYHVKPSGINNTCLTEKS